MLMAPVTFPEDQIRQDLATRYPLLTLSEKDGAFVVSGKFYLRQDETWIASYRLKVVLPKDYPQSMPEFYETGNRIPRDLDHHINGNDTLCLGVVEEIWIDLDGKFELLNLLDRHLRSYFIGATNMLEGKGWPYGERSHGPAGICAYYGGLIDTTEPLAVLDFILILTYDTAKGHLDCPCDSGKRLRNCHRDLIRDIHAKQLPREMLLNSAHLIIDWVVASSSLNSDEQNRFNRIRRQFEQIYRRNKI